MWLIRALAEAGLHRRKCRFPAPTHLPTSRGIGSRIVQGIRPELVPGALHGHPQRAACPGGSASNARSSSSRAIGPMNSVQSLCDVLNAARGRQERDAPPGLERTLHPRRADLRTSEPVQRTAGSQRNTRDDRGRWLRSCRGGRLRGTGPSCRNHPPDDYIRRVRCDSSSNARSAIGGFLRSAQQEVADEFDRLFER